MKSKLLRIHGFTVLELVMVLAVAAIVTGWGVPSIVDLIKNNRVTSQNNELIAMLNFAKSVAIRNGLTVPVVLTTSEDGWAGLVEEPSSEVDVAGCGEGVLRCAASQNVQINSGAVTLTFNNRGYLREADDPWTTETIFFQHDNCTGLRQRSRIDIMPTGQIRSCNLACGSNAACPL